MNKTGYRIAVFCKSPDPVSHLEIWCDTWEPATMIAMISVRTVVERMRHDLIGSTVRTGTDALVITSLSPEGDGWPLPLVIGCEDLTCGMLRRWRTELNPSGMSNLTDDEAAELFGSIVRAFLHELLVTGGPVTDLDEILDSP